MTVITAPPYYPQWRRHPDYPRHRYVNEMLEGVNVVRCPLYVPATPSSVRRLLHLLSFGITALGAGIRVGRSKPDVVVLIQPTSFAFPALWLCARIGGANSVMHIQDYELDAMINLKIINISFFERLAFIAERWLYRRFQGVSTISRSMVNMAVSKGVEVSRLALFPNWVNTHQLAPQAGRTGFHEEWGISEDQHVVMYSGNVGAKQGLEFLLAVALRMQDDSNAQFVIVGDGAGLSELKTMAAFEGIQNLRFLPLQPAERLPELLATADVHVVCQRRGAADIVLPSKLSGILSVGGHCVVTAEPDTELGRLAQEHPGLYECVTPESADALEQGIRRLLAKDLSTHNAVARRYAQEHLEKDVVLTQFAQWLEAQVAQDVVAA